MRLPKLVIAAAVIGLFAAGAANAADTLRIGTEGAYPPFNQIDATGKLIGFDIDIARALCEEMQVECEFVTQDWDGIIPGLLARKYDAIVASMSITEERQKAVAFTDKYWSNKLRFVAPKGSDFDPQKLDGATIGAQRATISALYLEDNFADQVDIKLYDTQENAYLDLATGRTDAVLADMLVSYDWLQTEEGQGFDFVGEAAKLDDRIGIAVRKEDEELVRKLNDAIAAIRANGTYAEINAKYFPFDIY
ncbi:MAG: ABC transporter substrate-binding protein [Rhodospirillales bacterium]|nr:ABC transporter substrate-binding protein [Rhodospirillales bacterium]